MKREVTEVFFLRINNFFLITNNYKDNRHQSQSQKIQTPIKLPEQQNLRNPDVENRTNTQDCTYQPVEEGGRTREKNKSKYLLSQIAQLAKKEHDLLAQKLTSTAANRGAPKQVREIGRSGFS